jgi:hypothetical protein
MMGRGSAVLICEECGAEFRCSPCHARTRRFCCFACSNAWHTRNGTRRRGPHKKYSKPLDADLAPLKRECRQQCAFNTLRGCDGPRGCWKKVKV